jgi:small subunit ribosomal protein S16
LWYNSRVQQVFFHVFRKEGTVLAAKIKLKRMGKKKKPFYRVIVQDIAESRRGRAIEEIGFYDPLLEDSKLDIDKDKVLDWISKGAQPTDTVRVLLGKAGILPPVSFEGKPKRKPKGEQPAEAEVKAEAKVEGKEEKPEKKAEAKAEAKAEVKAEVEKKPEPKPEPKAEAKEEKAEA